MTDDQFKRFTKTLNVFLDERFTTLKEEIRDEVRGELRHMDNNIDWLIGEVQDLRDELGFHMKQTDEQLVSHERRISKLELTTSLPS